MLVTQAEISFILDVLITSTHVKRSAGNAGQPLCIKTE